MKVDALRGWGEQERTYNLLENVPLEKSGILI
jgi:hypothetical protein